MNWNVTASQDKILCEPADSPITGNPVSSITGAAMTPAQFEIDIRRISKDSANVMTSWYFDERLIKLDYRLIDILEAITDGSFEDCKIKEERGSTHVIGFKVRKQFKGLAHKSYIVGWADLNLEHVWLTDLSNDSGA